MGSEIVLVRVSPLQVQNPSHRDQTPGLGKDNLEHGFEFQG